MLDIARAYFRLNVPRPREEELTQLAQQVFSDFELAAINLLPVDDFGVYVAVEEGSIKGRGKIIVTAGALYFGIAQFGSFVQGVKEIVHIGTLLAAKVLESAKQHSHSDEQPEWTRSNAGAATQLLNLFQQVQRRELLPSQATEMALKIFEQGGSLPPEASVKIADAFRDVKLYPEQFDFDFVHKEEPPESTPLGSPTPRRREPFPQTRLLIEIERSRRGTEPSIRRRYRKR